MINETRSLEKKLMLNLGCGEKKFSNYINIDIDSSCNPDLVSDVQRLPYNEESIDQIFASDILEHFSWRETRSILEHWYNILKSGGDLIIKTPNVDTIIDAYQVKRIPVEELARKLYGNQDSKGNFHCAGFNPEFLKKMLLDVGFKVLRVQEILDGGDYFNMAIRCQK